MRGCPIANNFSQDPNCKALWKFEPSDLFADSVGSNTLIPFNEALTPSSDTSLFKEGIGSAKFEKKFSTNHDRTGIVDVNLDSGFPFKNGDSVKKISITMWIRLASDSDDDNFFFTKTSSNTDTIDDFRASANKSTGVEFRIITSGTPTSSATFSHGSALVIQRWYHMTITYDGITGAYRISVWDSSTEALLAADATGTASLFGSATSTNALSIGNGAAPVGTKSFTGNIDEMAIFNDILTSDESTAIRGGTYIPNVLTGLDHLNGSTVSVIVDGAQINDEVVVDGQIAPDIGVLGIDYSCATVGLSSTYRVSPMRLDITTPIGTTHGSIKQISELVISFKDTLNAQYGDDVDTYDIEWRTEEAHDQAPDLFTGDKTVAFDGGFSTEDNIIISGSSPFPCTVRAIIPRIQKTGR